MRNTLHVSRFTDKKVFGSVRLVLRCALFAVQLDSVPPPALGMIHGLIRTGNERIDMIDVRGEHRDPDAHRLLAVCAPCCSAIGTPTGSTYITSMPEKSAGIERPLKGLQFHPVVDEHDNRDPDGDDGETLRQRRRRNPLNDPRSSDHTQGAAEQQEAGE